MDLLALRHNYCAIKKHLKNHKSNANIWSVVKADAYGHGLMRVADMLADKADGFALLDVEAAIALREAGIRQPIVLLEGVFEFNDVLTCLEYNLIPVVHSMEQLRMLSKTAPTLPLYLKFNTGMNRLGFSEKQISEIKQKLIHVTSEITLITHFANADDDLGINWQLERFKAFQKKLELPDPCVSLANSAAIFRYPQTFYDWVRPGITLYGGSPFPDTSAAELGLRPVMTLESEIIAIQHLASGERVGYGGVFTANHPMRIGIVACGYADGYPRHAPNGTPILVGSQRSALVGRVSMDLLACDLTHLPGADTGSRVVLWGEGLPAEEVAASAGTICYELFCALARRVPVIEV